MRLLMHVEYTWRNSRTSKTQSSKSCHAPMRPPHPSQDVGWTPYTTTRKARCTTRGYCRQDTYSQYTSVRYSLFTSAERTSRAWLKGQHGSSNHGLQFIFVRLKKICHLVLHMSHLLLFSPVPFTTSTSSPSFALPSTTTQEREEHQVHHAHLQAPSVDKLRHQESLWREDLQCGGNPRTTTPAGTNIL